ncbi:MAG: hypothetical protein IJ261_04505 [Clostridia bacterium]|nr:hypothetical protein [Clostridia bacterium]
MIDLHCHILHGIDDGARSLDESVQLCRIAVQNSIQTAVVTPHLVHPENVDEYVRIRDKRIDELKETLVKNDIPLQIIPGAEVFVNDDIFYAPSLDAVTLGGTKYILIEFDFKGLNINRIIKYVNEFISRGYVPIIAHPERYRFMQQNYDIVNHLADMGILFQVNSSSLAGFGGMETRELGFAMVASGIASFIGTDAHSVAHRPNNLLEQRDMFPVSVDFDVYDRLLGRNAQVILADGVLDRGRVYPIRRKRFF